MGTWTELSDAIEKRQRLEGEVGSELDVAILDDLKKLVEVYGQIPVATLILLLAEDIRESTSSFDSSDGD